MWSIDHRPGRCPFEPAVRLASNASCLADANEDLGERFAQVSAVHSVLIEKQPDEHGVVQLTSSTVYGERIQSTHIRRQM